MSKGKVRLEAAVDLFDVAKVEHVAREQGRDVEEVAAEMLEAEADKELAKAAKAKTRRKAPSAKKTAKPGKVELTLEGFDPQLADAVQRYADAKGMTWEEAANVLLKTGLDYARKMQGEFRKAKTAKPKKPRGAKAD